MRYTSWPMAVATLSVWLCHAHAQTSASPPAAPAQEPLKIGLIGAFTGPSADFCLPMQNGVKMAVDEINAVGGYLGRPVELVVKDDMAQPARGKSLAQEIVADKAIVATIGYCNTGVALAGIEVFQQAQMPLIVPVSTGTPVTQKFPAPDSYIFRTSPRDSIQVPFLIGDLLKRGWDKIAVFADTTGYGENGLKDVEAVLGARQLKPVYVARFPLGVTDLTAQLQEAKAAGANVILSYTVSPENAVIAKGREAMKWDVPQAGPWTVSFPFFVESAGTAAEGALSVLTFIPEPSNERRSTFLANYMRKYKTKGVPSAMSAAQGYDTMYLLIHALFHTRGNLTGPVIKQSLENMPRTHYGVVTSYAKPFGKDDKDAITSNMLYMGQIKNGAVTFAYPEDAKRNLIIQRKQ